MTLFRQACSRRLQPAFVPVLRACAKLTWQNARSGSEQCSIPNAQFLSEQSERLAIRHPLRLRIEHWELNIGQILGLMSSSEYCRVIFARVFRIPLSARPEMLPAVYPLCRHASCVCCLLSVFRAICVCA